MQLEQIDFLIIGATKSATTWLQQSLQADPDIFMPDPELHFFSREFSNGVEWYLSHFAGRSSSQKLTGEKSNSYLEDEHSAARIRTLLPNAKLVVQLRNPVERAYSDYCMLYRRNEVGKDIERYLDPKRSDGTRFLSGGLYATLLERYAETFPLSQIRVVFYEDIKLNPREHLATVRRFLGTDPYSAPPVSQKVKDKSSAVVGPRLRQFLAPAKPLVAPFRSTSAFKSFRSLIAREPNYSPLSAELRARLVEYYERDVERLGTILGRNLAPWLHSPAGA